MKTKLTRFASSRLVALLSIVLLLSPLLVAGGGGCAHWFRPPDTSNHDHVAPKPPRVPPLSLNWFDRYLDTILALSLLVIGVAVGLVFAFPAEHRISYALGAGSVSVLVVSLLLKVSLWLVPWIAGGLAVIGFAWLGLQMCLKYKAQRETAAANASLRVPLGR